MMPRFPLVLFLLPVVALADQPFHASLRFANIPSGVNPAAFAADASGDFFIASYTTTPFGDSEIRVDKVDPQGNSLGNIEFGATKEVFNLPQNTIVGMAIDSSGDLVVAGTAYFPGSSTAYFPDAGFVTKIDSQLQHILFLKYLGGDNSTRIGALALDKSGNIFVTGETSAADFPVTPGAFQTQLPADASYAFVTEMAANGQSIVFSTLFGNPAVSCLASADMCPQAAYTSGTAISVDPFGNIVIAGYTDAEQLPVTRGAFGQTCGGCGISASGSEVFAGFVAKFFPGGSELLGATYVPVAAQSAFGTLIQFSAVAFDPAGDVIAAGTTSGTLPVTSGALQSDFPNSSLGEAGFVMKLDPTVQQLRFSTYLGGAGLLPPFGFVYLGVNALAVDAEGVIWISGGSPPELLPAPNGTPLPGAPNGTPLPGGTYLAGLSSDGSSLSAIFTAPSGIAGLGLALTTNGATSLGSAGAMLTVAAGAGPSLVSVSNSAGGGISGAVAPYELVSFYGIGIGPETPVTAQAIRGVVGSALGGVQVLFDGTPAPLLYAGPTQINAIVPREIAGQSVTAVQIVAPSGSIQGPTLQVSPSQPGVVLSPEHDPDLFGPAAAAALNQDGTVNSARNPAKLGSVVSVWVSGAGISTYPAPDGTIRTASQTGFPTLPVAAFHVPAGFFVGFPGTPAGQLSLEVDYAGDAAGMVAGVTQVNFRLPSSLGLETVTSFLVGPPVVGVRLQIGEASSQPFAIFVNVPQQQAALKSGP